MNIKIEINNCKQCPHLEEKRHYTADSFEYAHDWFCKKNGRKIEGYISWNEEKDVKVPTWCPCKM